MSHSCAFDIGIQRRYAGNLLCRPVRRGGYVQGFRVGSIAEIPIKLDVTLLLILPVLAYLIGNGMSEVVNALNAGLDAGIDAAALSQGLVPWGLGLAAAIGLFVCVLLHELGHAAVARRYGYEIESITLWLLGGIARTEEQPRRWNHELWIALAGPVVSVAVGVGCFWPSTPSRPTRRASCWATSPP